MPPLRKKCIRQLHPPPQRGDFRAQITQIWFCIAMSPPGQSPQLIRLKTEHETRALVCMDAFESDNNNGLMRMGLLACYASNAFTTSVTIDTNYRDNCHDSPFQLARYFVTADTN